MFTTLKRSLAVLCVLPLLTAAADYPKKQINIVVPSSAGGSTDTTARLFSEIAKTKLDGSKMQIVNKAGAGGLSGFEYIARSKADGYTLGLVFTPQLIAHMVSGKAKHDLDTFSVLGNVADDPAIIVVHKDSPINNLDELVQLAKEKTLVTSVNGIGSDDFLAAKNFERSNGVKFNLVPTKGSTEQKTAILGNHVDVAFMNLSQMLSQYKAGNVKILATLVNERSRYAPDIPTAKEQGYNTLMTATRGFVVHKDVDPEIKATLEKLIADVLADEEFIARAEQSYIFLAPMSGEEYTTYLKELQASTQEIYDETPW